MWNVKSLLNTQRNFKNKISKMFLHIPCLPSLPKLNNFPLRWTFQKKSWPKHNHMQWRTTNGKGLDSSILIT